MLIEKPLATIRSYAELVAVLRARSDELDVTREVLDEAAGLPARYSTKLLGPSGVKKIGPMSLGALLGVLGLKLLVVEDKHERPPLPKRQNKKPAAVAAPAPA